MRFSCSLLEICVIVLVAALFDALSMRESCFRRPFSNFFRVSNCHTLRNIVVLYGRSGFLCRVLIKHHPDLLSLLIWDFKQNWCKNCAGLVKRRGGNFECIASIVIEEEESASSLNIIIGCTNVSEQTFHTLKI